MPGPELGEPCRPTEFVVLQGVVDRPAKLFADSVRALVLSVQIECEVGQPDPGQTLLDDVECCLFLGDEQDRLAVAQRVRDEIGDRLRLSSSGRAFEHERAALRGHRDRP